MSFSSLFEAFFVEQKYQSLNFAADRNLKALVFQRLTEVEHEIGETEPGDCDPVEYTRQMQDLHARKDELKDLSLLLQKIVNQNKPKQREV